MIPLLMTRSADAIKGLSQYLLPWPGTPHSDPWWLLRLSLQSQQLADKHHFWGGIVRAWQPPCVLQLAICPGSSVRSFDKLAIFKAQSILRNA